MLPNVFFVPCAFILVYPWLQVRNIPIPDPPQPVNHHALSTQPSKTILCPCIPTVIALIQNLMEC